MKKLVKIKSVSDVITNSSSEVFLMNYDDAQYFDTLPDTNGCITLTAINWEYLSFDNYCSLDMLQEICDITNEDLESYGMVKTPYWYDDTHFYYEYNKESWDRMIEANKQKIEERLIGMYLVDIEDKFEGCQEVTESAHNNCTWSESRH